MTVEVKLRVAQLGDIPRLTELCASLRLDQSLQVSLVQLASSFAAREKDAMLLVACIDDVIIAFVDAQRDTNVTNGLLLRSILVIPQHRRKGVATAMWHHVHRWAYLYGMRGVVVSVTLEQGASLPWFVKQGFRVRQVLSNEPVNGVDSLRLARMFDEPKKTTGEST